MFQGLKDRFEEKRARNTSKETAFFTDQQVHSRAWGEGSHQYTEHRSFVVLPTADGLYTVYQDRYDLDPEGRKLGGASRNEVFASADLEEAIQDAQSRIERLIAFDEGNPRYTRVSAVTPSKIGDDQLHWISADKAGSMLAKGLVKRTGPDGNLRQVASPRPIAT